MCFRRIAVVNNAGIAKVNVEGVLWGIQASAKKLKAGKQKGKIISAASIAGHEAFPLLDIYSASKFGQSERGRARL